MSLREARLARGEHQGGVAPLGYRRVAGALVVDELEARTVRAVFNAYLKEPSLARAAAALKAQGRRSRGEKNFSPSTLASILSNPTYTGAVRLRGTIAQGTHPPLVSAETFVEVREKLRAGDRHLRVRLPEGPALDRASQDVRAALQVLAALAGSGRVKFVLQVLAGAPIARAVERIRELRAPAALAGGAAA